MDNSSRTAPKRDRDIFYYRRRYKNRVFAALVSFFAAEAERTGISKKDVALRLKRDPSQITRWLSNPGNLTLETISDLLLAFDAEAEPPQIVRFSERSKKNYAHPLMIRTAGRHEVTPENPAIESPRVGASEGGIAVPWISSAGNRFTSSLTTNEPTVRVSGHG